MILVKKEEFEKYKFDQKTYETNTKHADFAKNREDYKSLEARIPKLPMDNAKYMIFDPRRGGLE